MERFSPLSPDEAASGLRARFGAGRRLSADEAAARLRARFGDSVLDVVEQHGHIVVTVTRERYHDLCRFLRDEPEFGCDFADLTSGVDWGQERGFEVVTHLFSTTNHHNIRVKVMLPHDDAVVATVSDLWATCDWHERETAEMFGVRFQGHPQPVKLLLSEPFEGHPLRKDFALMTREAKPWPGAVEGEEDEDE
ncbi:MAG: NADH-quinone oxidoreductase subunit C [Actinomycetota bacterium]|nr:NADH-quinone oxidoreductase subunit C [Actinomycetota bacterium]